MILFTQFDAESGLWELYCSSKGMRAMPAGPRIFRGPPHPVVQFAHETKAAAERDAQKIREYLANLPERKISKKEIRRQPV